MVANLSRSVVEEHDRVPDELIHITLVSVANYGHQFAEQLVEDRHDLLPQSLRKRGEIRKIGEANGHFAVLAFEFGVAGFKEIIDELGIAVGAEASCNPLSL